MQNFGSLLRAGALALALCACAQSAPIDEAPVAATSAASCVNHCGGSSSDGSCYCDDQCQDYGDCCSDLAKACSGAPSSAADDPNGGQAGAPASSGGAAGANAGSGGSSNPPLGPGCTPSLCNTQTPGKAGSADCYCDATCIVYGDCCGNKVSVCGP